VLLDQVRDGNLIYHGNVGHLLLSGLDYVLRVRITADLEYRLQAAVAQAGMSRDQALSHIQRVDEARSRWAQLLYGCDCTDPTQYDVTLNLGKLDAADAVAVIVQLAEMEAFRVSDTGRKQFQDLHLASRVWAALARNPHTRSAGLRVVANDGDVTITGNLNSPRAVELLPTIARDVPGVRNISCEAGMGTDWYW
jgi:osmotically-inducible protein OsmY